jgi:hypothetical protein
MAAPMDGDPAYWAVIEHHRVWWAADGPIHRKIEQDGKLLVDVASLIARDYRVARTITSVDDGKGNKTSSLPELVAAINAANWPISLAERAATCISIAENHAKATKGATPTSAVTKLMWFLRPSGWTMFDKFARIGLIGSNNDARAFYTALDGANFVKRSQDLKALCSKHGFGKLWGERIIDKFLMLHGARKEAGTDVFHDRTMWLNREYLAMLPDATRGALHALATDVKTDLSEGKTPFPLWRRN